MNTEIESDSTPLQLPDLQDALLEWEVIVQLFRDIDQCTQVLEVTPKSAVRGFVSPIQITLEDAREQLLSGEARAVQIRYRYEDAEWWDTIMKMGPQYRVVRIQH